MKDDMKLEPCSDGNSNQIEESFKFDLGRTEDKYAQGIKRWIPVHRLGWEREEVGEYSSDKVRGRIIGKTNMFMQNCQEHESSQKELQDLEHL